MHRCARRRRTSASAVAILIACILALIGCAPRALPQSGSGAEELGGSGAGAAAGSASRAGSRSARLDEPASFDLHFVNGTAARKTQALSGARYEIRALYTEAVVRSSSEQADYHIGLMSRPGSLAGYSLNLPSPGTPAPAGVPRLRFAQHPVTDDPVFPSLVDGTKMLNPTTSQSVYFMGKGILRTAHAGSFPPPLQDAFAPDVSSSALGSANDVGSLKLAVAENERLFNDLWSTGTSYDDPGGNHPLAPAIVDRDLTDNTSLVKTRYYKWSIPFAATAFHFGNGLPLGRLVMDIRIIGSSGQVVASGGRQLLLQAGSNQMTFVVSANEQGLVSLAGDLTDLSNRSRVVLFSTGSLVPGDSLTVQVTSDVPIPHRYEVTVTVDPGDTLEMVAAKVASAINLVEPFPIETEGGPAPYRIQSAGYRAQAATLPARFSDEFRIIADRDLLSIARVDGTVRQDQLAIKLDSSAPAATSPIAGAVEALSEGSISFGGAVNAGDMITISLTNGLGHVYETTVEADWDETLDSFALRVAEALNDTVSSDESETFFDTEYSATAEGATVVILGLVAHVDLDSEGDGLEVSVSGTGIETVPAQTSPGDEESYASLTQELAGDARAGDTATLKFDTNGQTYEAAYVAAGTEAPDAFAAGLAEAFNAAQSDYTASSDGATFVVSANSPGSAYDFPAGAGMVLDRPEELGIAEIEDLTGGVDGPGSQQASGSVALVITGVDQPRAGQSVKVYFTNKAGHQYQASYIIQAEDIGATAAETLSSVAEGLADALAAGASDQERDFALDYQVSANAVSAGSITVEALTADSDLESDAGGPLSVSRLVPLTFTVAGPMRSVTPED